MKLSHEFEVDADLDQTWALLKDLERIMPCMPGATLEGRDGEDYLGSVKIKVGPIGAHFRGTARYARVDEAARAAVIAAAGKDPRGQAGVSATIHARLEPVGPTRTRALLDTDVDISGRMAQFGRGAIADVGNRVIGQFAVNIGRELSGPGAAPVSPASAPTVEADASPAYVAPSASTASPPAAAPADMDVMALVVPMIKERYGQAIVGGLLGFALSWLAFGRGRRP